MTRIRDVGHLSHIGCLEDAVDFSWPLGVGRGRLFGLGVAAKEVGLGHWLGSDLSFGSSIARPDLNFLGYFS
jgi:hypothetical protein